MNEPPQWFIKHLSKYTEKSKRIGEIVKFLPIMMKLEGVSWTQKFVEEGGLNALFNIFKLYVDCIVIGSKSEKQILTHTALSMNHIFLVAPRLFENEFLKIEKSILLFSRLIDSSVSDIRWNTLILLTTLAMQHEQGYKLVYDATKDRFENVCLKLKTDTAFEKKLYIIKYLAVMITHGKAYALKHQILGELKRNGILDLLKLLCREIKARKETHAYHDNKDGAKDLTDLMEGEIVIIRKAFETYNPQYNEAKIQRVYETLIFKINKFSEVKKDEVISNLSVLLNNVVSHVDEQLEAESQYSDEDNGGERILDQRMDLQFWKDLHEVSAKRVQVKEMKKSMRAYQKTLKKMKRQLDNIRERHTLERLEFTRERVSIIKYIEKLNVNLNVFLEEKDLEGVPENSPRSVNEIYRLMKRMKVRFKEALESQKK